MQFRQRMLALLVPAALSAMPFVSAARADLVLETETAQLGKQGTFATSAAVQMERERNGGYTYLTLNQFEYAITDRAEILVEPFFYEWSNPKDGPSFQGVGDLEITPSYMIVEEKKWIPALVAAFKVKVPMATNRNIGTGEFDYQPFLIVGKTYGPWVFNFNIGYDFVTSPNDEPLKDQWISDFSVEYIIRENWSVYFETFYNSSPARGEKETLSFAVATEYRLSDHWNVFVSLGDDTDGLITARTGFNYEIGFGK